jgi:hypothetical protein
MNRWCFDIEVYKDLFCVTFANVESKEVKVFSIFDNVNQSYELSQFLDDDKQLVGYNNIDYDNPVMQYLVQNRDWCTTKDVFNFSTQVISLERGGYSKEIREYKFAKTKYTQIDLMKIIEVNGNVPSLKMVGIILHWHRIQDLPYPFDYKVKSWEEANEIISYNLNDVLISEKLYEKLSPEIELREKLSAMYNLSLLSFSDSKIGDKLLEKFYSENTGEKDVWSLRDKVKKYEKFYVSECIFPDVKFQTNYMKRMLREVGDTLVRSDNNFAFTKLINFGGVDYKVASGGLHSVDFPAKFVTDENYVIRDCDFSSYYPSMMIKNKIYPDHISPNFIDILKSITDERIKSKKTDKVKAAGLKITINAIFGKLGFDGSWFKDSKAFLSVTVPGQMYLLMLIERFVLAGIQVISANTDGIVCRIDRKLEDEYYEIAKGFEKEIGIGIEFTDYEIYFRRDVNNYISVKHKDDGKFPLASLAVEKYIIDGINLGESLNLLCDNEKDFNLNLNKAKEIIENVKTKGVYSPFAEIKKGYKYPLVGKSIYRDVVNDISFEETVRSHRNILDFCASQKMGAEFVAQYHKDNGEIEDLQKTNRFFISLAGGRLMKKNKKNEKEIGLYVGKNVRILNDFDKDTPFETYDIDYDYYISECHALIDDVINFQEEMIPFIDEDENYSPPQEDKEKSELSYVLRNMKGLPEKVVENLVWLKRNFEGKDFLEFLVFGEENSKLSSKFEDLIKIGYFSEYGTGKKLLDFFIEFKKGKSKYTNKLAEKSKNKRKIELREIYQSIPDKEFSVMEKIANEICILGKIETKFENLKDRLGFVVELDTKNSPKAKIQSLKLGNIETFKISRKIFGKNEFCVGQILKLPNGSIGKKQAVKFAGEDENGKAKYETIPDRYDYWLNFYEIINEV